MRSAGYAIRFVLFCSAILAFSPVSAVAQCTWNGATPPFLVTSGCVNAQVGVNTTTPAFPLEIVRDGGNVQLTGTGYAAAGGATNFLGRGARGSMGAPTATQANDFLMVMGGRGHTGAAFSTQNSSRIAFRAGSNFSGTSQGGFITFDTVNGADPGLALTTRLTVAQDGHIGIGAPPGPTALLTVAGDVSVTGNLAAKYQDIAEWVSATEPLDAGVVVVLNPDKTNEVMASLQAYDSAVAGIVSSKPGLILGEAADNKEQIATTGRVMVRVDATANPIRIGDLLVTSEKRGTAMKSVPVEFGGVKMHRPGTIVGKALEPLDKGEGEILVLLSLQ